MNKRAAVPAIFPGGAVPVPNRLFDDVLPTLKDSELRVLLIVLRQTIGWREGDELGGWRFKRRDWISHAQLCTRTGRGSEAVSSAVDALVRRGLIVVEDAKGTPLSTPEARRRCLSRHYFRPAEVWTGDMCKTGDPFRPGKPKTTTDNIHNKKDGFKRAAYWSGAAAAPRRNRG